MASGSTGVSATAYTNSYGQSLTGGVTTLYTLDSTLNTLFIQNPPNNGNANARAMWSRWAATRSISPPSTASTFRRA